MKELEAVGLNVAGVADGAPYAGLLPGCRAVVVYASGGTALWDAFVDAVRRDPDWFRATADPLDDFVRRALERVGDGGGRWIRCGAGEAAAVDFRLLAWRAGLGWRSRLGLLLHPDHGPWMGLRAAWLTTEARAVTGPLPGGGPCDGCPAPCRAACPGGAMPEAGWDVGACAAYVVAEETCRGGCLSRRACPVGAAHAYSALEQRYHTDHAAGRRALAEALGIAEPGEGTASGWRGWV